MKKKLISILLACILVLTVAVPVLADASDVTIDAAASTSQYLRALRSGIFWTSPTVGYVIYLNATHDLVHRKTADGGATWGDATAIVAAASCDASMYDCWADWQTDGDVGTKIHIAYISRDTNEIRYVYLDTSDDSVGGDDLIEACQGTGVFFGTIGIRPHMVSITKTRGGNFAVALKYQDSDNTIFSSFYTSPDADTWTSETTPYEHEDDYCLLFPGNEADDQDVWSIYWDVSEDEISLKTYDDSGNSWSEQSISGSMAEGFYYLQMDGAIRLSDGHLILAAWSQFDNAAADLRVWDINGAGSITAKTNVLTDSAESFLVSVFINQDNDDIYVAYTKGTTVPDLVAVFYQLSQNGGTNWDGQTALQDNADDDERWISCGAVKAIWGGKFQPVWFNDDLDDIFTNTDNGISIAAVVAPTVTTNAATYVAQTTARLNSTVTDDGGQACDIRFGYGDETRLVGDFEDYDTKTDWVNDTYTTGQHPFFDAAGLTDTHGYFYRAQIRNNHSTVTSVGEIEFTTEAGVAVPANLKAFPTSNTVGLTWTKGVGATNTMIRYSEVGYPVDETEGTQAYLGPLASYIITNLTAGHTYYIVAISNSGAVYSATVEVLATTTAGGAVVEEPTDPAMPTGWFQSPDHTGLSGLPLYDQMNDLFNAYDIPPESGWFFSAILGCVVLGAVVFVISRHPTPAVITLAVAMAIASLIKLLPLYMMAFSVVFIIGVWQLGRES